MNREGWTASEAEDAIASMLDDYDSYMRRHHKRMTRGRLEVIVTTSADVLEELTHLKFAPTVERLFRLFRDEADATSPDLDAPGREVAYIYSARKHFRSS